MRRDPIKSAARTLEVLELFHEQRTPLRLKYIFERLSYPQSSTTSLLKSMVMLGYLNYDRPTRTYFPTPRIAALGDWINHYVYGAGELFSLMDYIFERTNETVVLSSQNDIFVQHLRVLQPSHPYKIPPSEGSMRLLTHSAAGLVLLSRMTPKAVDKLRRHINAYEQGRSKPVDMDELNEQLTWIRREGYSLLAAFPFPDAAGLAIPLPLSPHGAPLTIGVGGLNSRIARRKSEIIDIMHDAIADYERKRRTALADIDLDAGEIPAIDAP